MLKKKRTWIILGIVAVLIGGGVYLATRAQSSQASASQLLANAQTASVLQTTLFTSVDSTGSIMPEAAVNLSFGTSGTVAEVKVEVGDVVQQGAVLATLDTTDLQYQVTQAEQSYRLQQLTYSETMQADTGAIAIAQASYSSVLACLQRRAAGLQQSGRQRNRAVLGVDQRASGARSGADGLRSDCERPPGQPVPQWRLGTLPTSGRWAGKRTIGI